MKVFKYISSIFLILLIAFYFFNTNNQKKESINVDISIYNGLSSILFFIAKDYNFFEEEGLNVNLNLHNSGKKAVDTLLNNEVLYANGSEFVAVKQSFTNNNFKIIASTSEASINGVIVKTERINKEIDIKNKRIALTKGTASEYYTGVFLEHIGLNISDINMYNLNANKVNDFLLNDEIDGFFTWEPFIYSALKSNKENLEYYPVPKGYEFYFCLFVNSNELKENKETSKKILNALLKAEKWMNYNQTEFNKYAMKKFNFDTKYFNYIKSNYNITISLSSSMYDTILNEANWLIDNDIVENKKSKNYMKLLDSNILESIDKSLVNLKKK